MLKKKLLIMEMIVGVKKNFYAKIKELNNSLINKDAKIEHSKPYIYEKLLKKESEKEKEKEKENKNNKFKYNIN